METRETRAVLLIFSLKHEISGVTVQGIHQNSKKMAAFRKEFLSENHFEAF